jgi:hypothetical protein
MQSTQHRFPINLLQCRLRQFYSTIVNTMNLLVSLLRGLSRLLPLLSTWFSENLGELLLEQSTHIAVA